MDVKEFKGFLAIILSFGIVKYPAREDAWHGPHSSRFVSSIMSCARFKAISAAWHWEDYSALVPEEPLLDRSKRARAASTANELVQRHTVPLAQGKSNNWSHGKVSLVPPWSVWPLNAMATNEPSLENTALDNIGAGSGTLGSRTAKLLPDEPTNSAAEAPDSSSAYT